MRWLVGMAMLFCLGVAVATARPEGRATSWLGHSQDGASCYLGVSDGEWVAGCGDGCVIPIDVRGRGVRLRGGGFAWTDARIHIDTRDDSSFFPGRDGKVWRAIRWSALSWSEVPELPGPWPWIAVGTLLVTTLLAFWWQRRPRPPRLDLAQLAVEDGHVLPLRPPRGSLPRAEWPDEVPLAGLGPGRHWVAGRREGGRGGGLREIEPRFEVVHVSSTPIRALDLAPALTPAAPLLSRSERCLWLVALFAPVAAGSVAVGLLVAAAAMAFVVAVCHDLFDRVEKAG